MGNDISPAPLGFLVYGMTETVKRVRVGAVMTHVAQTVESDAISTSSILRMALVGIMKLAFALRAIQIGAESVVKCDELGVIEFSEHDSFLEFGLSYRVDVRSSTVRITLTESAEKTIHP